MNHGHSVVASSTIAASPIEQENGLLHHQFNSTTTTHSSPVFHLIQRIRKEIITLIDTPLSYEQLKTPAINFSVVRPLLLKLSKNIPPCLIYSLLVNRVNFKNEAASDLAFFGVNTSRADLCELLAIKLLSAYDSMELLTVVSTNFSPFDGIALDNFVESEGVDEAELKALEAFGLRESSNALELAIFSKAKRFVKHPITQEKIIEPIYTGSIIYQPEGSHSLIKDDYKKKAVIQFYDWRTEPFLDHYRLKVPQIRSQLELVAFGTLILLFMIAQATWTDSRINLWEGLFIVYSLGFALDELASILENGLAAYLLGVYNILDAMFCFIFFTFLALRISALSTGNLARSDLAFNTLAMAATILFPRLTLSLIRGNVILLALSAMVKEFLFFMSLATLTASGFLISLHILARNSWSWGKIAALLGKIYLGSSFLGFEVADQFHPVYGPILIVSFAILSQTLLLTILISLLSNTFTIVQQNAQSELLNQKALRTIERVKGDALSSYVPPLNLVAFMILLPLRYMTNPRWFHKINVFMIKLFNFPVLLLIALITRAQHKNYMRSTTISLTTQRIYSALPRGIPWEGTVESIGKIFERELTDKATYVHSIDSIDEEEGEEHRVVEEPEEIVEVGASSGRRGSVASRESLVGINKNSGSAKSRLMQHKRLGSLASPLAKMFTLHGQVLPESKSKINSPSTIVETEKKSSTNEKDSTSKGLEERLDNIENMLKALLGEVSKNSSGKEGKGVSQPLRSLSGENEESYESGSDS